jgi:pyruvate/2-oxoglutarate/acetoin dehydrogenase E1 component
MVTEVTISQALNKALKDAMLEDDRVFLLGEEITNWGRGGGLYDVTQGLLGEFGRERVRDVPISEEAIISVAVGAAIVGYKPIIDINYSDFLLLAMNPIVNEAAKYRYVFNGQHTVPVVIRANTGAAGGKGAQHSQSLETIFAHIPGLEVVLPSTPNSAYWLLRDAISSPNPTIFLEHKALYNLKGCIQETPVHLGVAEVVRAGRDATVIGTQLMIQRSLEVAQRLYSEGIDLEVVDVQSLFPLDLATIVDSARKTRHVLICHEAPLLYGFGGELSAAIMEECWRELDAPIRRLGGSRTPIPFAPSLEAEVIPSVELIEAAVRALIA